jgi:hypothetical protein
MGYYPILPSTWTFSTVLDVDQPTQKKICVTRSQLPIQPGFAVTGHSSQGKTLPHVLVNMHEGGFAAYVAVSRAHTREGLCLMECISLMQLNKRVSNDLYAEITRFDALEHNSLVSRGFRQGELVHVPDAEGESTLTSCSISVHYSELSNKDKPPMGKKHRLSKSDPPVASEAMAGTSRPKKHVRLAAGPSPELLGQAGRAMANTVQSTVGCRWSAENSYDSIFMALFYIFRGLSKSLWEFWLGSKNILGELARSFGMLMLSKESMMSSDLFDALRDRMHDSLFTIDPNAFPCYGLHFASVSRILEAVFLDNMPMLGCMQQRGMSHTQHHFQDLNVALPSLCIPGHLMLLDGPSMSVQDWLLAFLQMQSEKIATSNCQGPCIGRMIVLRDTPAVLTFKVASNTACAIVPSITLTLPSQELDATYQLQSILYYGSGHFTAWMFLLGHCWIYDGMLNRGCPIGSLGWTLDSNH